MTSLPRKWNKTFKRESNHSSTCEMDYCGISKIGFMFRKGGLKMCSWKSAMMGHLLTMVAQSAPQRSLRSPTIGLIWKTMQRNTWRLAWFANKIKHSIKKKTRLLWPLLILEGSWESVSMDFMVSLPPSRGFDAILVVVDWFSKMAYFIPTKESATAQETRRLFFTHMFKHHGLPKDIVSDRDPKFTSKFWQTL